MTDTTGARGALVPDIPGVEAVQRRRSARSAAVPTAASAARVPHPGADGVGDAVGSVEGGGGVGEGAVSGGGAGVGSTRVNRVDEEAPVSTDSMVTM